MTMATLKIVFWALAFVFFVVCEVATGTALVSIWLAIAALIAMFCAIAKLSFLTQCIVFVVSSVHTSFAYKTCGQEAPEQASCNKLRA